MSCLPVRPNAVRCQPWSAEIHLRFPVSCDHVLTHKFSLPFHIVIGHKLVVTSFADGSGGPIALRTSPLASELLPTAKHFHSRAALAGLTCRATPANPSPFAALTTPERLRSLRSASSLSFLVTCQRQVIPSHSFAALAALVVRRGKGNVALLVRRTDGLADQPSLACARCRTPPGGALARAPGSGTLPPRRWPRLLCAAEKATWPYICAA